MSVVHELLREAQKDLTAALDEIAPLDIDGPHGEALDSASDHILKAMAELHRARVDFAFAAKGVKEVEE